mgnify:FL=1
MQEVRSIPEASIMAFPPPAIQGLGATSGFEMQIEDRGVTDSTEMQAIADEMVAAWNAQSGLSQLQTTFRSGVPQIYVDVDRVKVKSLDVPLGVVFGTLQASLGSAYVNDFNKFGRTWQVRVQADQRFRLKPEDIKRLEVRNRSGRMIPLGTFARVEKVNGPQIIPRYNLYPAATINGQAAPGFSSGQAMALMERMAEAKLPGSIGYEWTRLSFSGLFS